MENKLKRAWAVWIFFSPCDFFFIRYVNYIAQIRRAGHVPQPDQEEEEVAEARVFLIS